MKIIWNIHIILAVAVFSAKGDEVSWSAGGLDVDGVRMNGTEVMKLTTHKGHLFAATSLWMEEGGSLGGGQVLVKEGVEAPWKVDLSLDGNHSRVTSLESFVFERDIDGREIKPVRLLLAGATARKGSRISVWLKKDKLGGWMELSLGDAKGSSQIRGMGFHRDTVTGVDRVFVGVSGNKVSEPSLGMLSGAYRKGAKGRIVWSKKPELRLPKGERFMEFAVCNGSLYASSSNHIRKRIDGVDPRWESVYYDKKLTAPGGIRGLCAVPSLAGGNEALMFITNGVVRVLETFKGNSTKVELDIANYVKSEWRRPIDGVLAGYNKTVQVRSPDSRDVWLIGFQCSYDEDYVQEKGVKALNARVRDDGRRPIRYFATERHFLLRAIEGGKAEYALRRYPAVGKGTSGAVRTLCPSPFMGEENVLYLGGGECNGMPEHDSGWVYRVEAWD